MKHLKKKKTSYILKGVGSFHFSCNKRTLTTRKSDINDQILTTKYNLWSLDAISWLCRSSRRCPTTTILVVVVQTWTVVAIYIFLIYSRAILFHAGFIFLLFVLPRCRDPFFPAMLFPALFFPRCFFPAARSLFTESSGRRWNKNIKIFTLKRCWICDRTRYQ